MASLKPSAPARVFFALWPEPLLARQLQALAEAGAAAGGGRPMGRDTLHLTLAFIGDVAADLLPQLLEVGRQLAGQTAFPLEFSLDRFGYWRHNRILWTGCTGAVPALQTLAADLAAALRQRGFALEQRPYLPHVTLVRRAARAEAAELWAAARNAAPRPLQWQAREMCLLRSRRDAAGAAYETLGRWPVPGEGRA